MQHPGTWVLANPPIGGVWWLMGKLASWCAKWCTPLHFKGKGPALLLKDGVGWGWSQQQLRDKTQVHISIWWPLILPLRHPRWDKWMHITRPALADGKAMPAGTRNNLAIAATGSIQLKTTSCARQPHGHRHRSTERIKGARREKALQHGTALQTKGIGMAWRPWGRFKKKLQKRTQRFQTKLNRWKTQRKFQTEYAYIQ